MIVPLRFLLATAAFALAGCAAAPSANGARAGRVDESAVIAIQAEIDRAVAQGEEGIRRYRDGEAEAAAGLFAQAREQLTAIAGRCVAMPGCEIERAYVDKGYRGHDAQDPRRIFISGQKRGVFGEDLRSW